MRIVTLLSAGLVGGLERAAIDGSRALADAGHDVTIVLLSETRGSGHEALTRAVAQAGVPFRRVDTDQAVDLAAFLSTRKVLQELSPDVVHSHGAKADVFAFAAAPSHTVRVVTCHGHDLRPGALGWLQSRAWSRAHLLVAVSRETAEWLQGAAGLTATVVENGVPWVEPLEPPQGLQRIGFAGRLVAGKRVDVLLEAVARLRRRGSPVTLDIAGDGPLRARFESQAAALGLGSAARFHGNVDDMKGFYAGIDALALASDSEGRPLVLLEAMALGRAVAASDVGGVGDLLQEQRGLVVSDRDGDPVEAWAQALQQLVGVEGASCRIHALRTAPQRTLTRWAVRMAALYLRATLAHVDEPTGALA